MTGKALTMVPFNPDAADQYRKELLRMGLKPGMRVLPPHIVKWIADKFCIDLET